MRLSLLFSFAILFLVGACVNPPEFPNEPVITFESLNKSQIYQFTNGPLDSIQIHFSFTDGDGNLSQLDSGAVDVFLTDSRIGLESPFRLPAIPSEGTGNGISGDIFLNLINTTGVCCIFNNRLCAEDPTYPVDTFSYTIQIQDRAGNRSNIIRTDVIEILCLGQ